MPLPPETLVIASLVVAGAFIVFGLTGFGSTILAVPLLAHLLPLKFVIPMFVLLDFGENQGALERGELIVRRGDKLVGKVSIVKVQSNRCIANILPQWKQGDVAIAEGDQVLY